MHEISRQDCLPDFVDLLLDTVFLGDAGGRVLYVNAACERMFGYTPGEFIGQSLLDFVSPEDRARTPGRSPANHRRASSYRIREPLHLQ